MIDPTVSLNTNNDRPRGLDLRGAGRARAVIGRCLCSSSFVGGDDSVTRQGLPSWTRIIQDRV